MVSILNGLARGVGYVGSLINLFGYGAGAKSSETDEKVSRVVENWWNYDPKTKTLLIKDAHIDNLRINAILVRHADQVNHLVINCLELKNLVALSSHKGLTLLNLEGCKKLESLNGIPENLETLILSNNYNLRDFSPIGKLAKLKSLSVSDMPYFADKQGRLAFIVNLKNLQLFNVQGCPLKEGMSILRPLKRGSSILISRSVT